MLFRFRPDAPIDPTWFLNFLKKRPDLQFLPPTTLRLDMRGPSVSPSAAARTRDRAGHAARPHGVSWWTARATAGAVTAGFSRDEILREAASDPLAAGGIFDRVADVLEVLTASQG